MVALHWNNYTLELPERYNECTPEQLVALGTVMMSGLPEVEQRIVLLQRLGNRSGYWWHYRGKRDAEMIAAALPHLDWVYDSAQLLTEQKFFRVPANGRVHPAFYGPKSELRNCTLAEFHQAEMAYRKLLDERPGAMDELIAVLWREGKRPYNLEKDVDGDIRLPFNQNTLPWRAHRFRRWPIGRKWAAVRFFDGCRQLLIQKFPRVFDAGEVDGSYVAFDGMFRLMRSLAGDARYGDFDKVMHLNLYTALYELTVCLEEQDAAEAALQTN